MENYVSMSNYDLGRSCFTEKDWVDMQFKGSAGFLKIFHY